MRFRKTLTFLIRAAVVVFVLSAWAHLPQMPLTQGQVQSPVRDGFGDESGTKLIEQHGINFAPAEDFIRSSRPREGHVSGPSGWPAARGAHMPACSWGYWD